MHEKYRLGCPGYDILSELNQQFRIKHEHFGSEIRAKMPGMLSPTSPEAALRAEHRLIRVSYLFAFAPLGDFHHSAKTDINPDRQADR
jgi:hypothetical protein